MKLNINLWELRDSINEFIKDHAGALQIEIDNNWVVLSDYITHQEAEDKRELNRELRLYKRMLMEACITNALATTYVGFESNYDEYIRNITLGSSDDAIEMFDNLTIFTNEMFEFLDTNRWCEVSYSIQNDSILHVLEGEDLRIGFYHSICKSKNKLYDGHPTLDDAIDEYIKNRDKGAQ